jgi:hypothetical protein
VRRSFSVLTGFILVAAMTILGPPSALASELRNGRIAYDQADPGSPGDTFVYVARSDGSHARLLVSSHTCCAGWSPYGTRLTLPRLTSDGRIGTATVNADGSGYRPLPISDPTLNIGCGTGTWSPDGRWLFCEAWDDSNPARNGIYKMRAANGRGLQRVTSNPVGGHDIPGSFSPNGERIVFVRFDQDGNSVGLFTVHRDRSHVHQIMSAGTLLNIGADWSPRDEILFSRHVTADARGSMWTVHPDGSGLHELRVDGLACGGALSDPTSVGCHAPRWSPDGDKVIFASNTQTSVDIFIASASGLGLVQVTHDGTDDNPDWGARPNEN